MKWSGLNHPADLLACLQPAWALQTTKNTAPFAISLNYSLQWNIVWQKKKNKCAWSYSVKQPLFISSTVYWHFMESYFSSKYYKSWQLLLDCLSLWATLHRLVTNWWHQCHHYMYQWCNDTNARSIPVLNKSTVQVINSHFISALADSTSPLADIIQAGYQQPGPLCHLNMQRWQQWQH